MAKIRIRDQRDNKWISGREFTPPQVQQHFSGEKQKQLDATLVRVHELGDEATPELFEVVFEPHFVVDVHSHAADEILYVIKGSLELGRRSLGPGSSVLVRADTLYSFRAGAEGLQVLNFRPRADFVYRTREQHMAWMRSKKDKQSDLASRDEHSLEEAD